MNLSLHSKLRAIVDDIQPIFPLKNAVKFSQIKDHWEMATYYNKFQNRCLKENDTEQVIKELSLYDHSTDDIKWYVIRANKQYTRKQYFIILLCESNYCTYEQIKLFLEKY